jgi:hypothetical protein
VVNRVDTLQRFKDIDGLPKIEMRTPEQFFERCKKDMIDVPVWVGELVRFFNLNFFLK